MRIRDLLWAATTRLRNRIVIIATSLAGLMVIIAGEPWIGLGVTCAGVASSGVLIVRDMLDPQLIRKVHGLKDPPQLSEATEALLRQPLRLDLAVDAVEPERHRELVRDILSAHEAIRAHLLGASSTVRPALVDTYRRCTEMAVAAGPLAGRGQRLNDYISTHQRDRLRDDTEALEGLADETDDDKARSTFRAAARARHGHLNIYRDVEHLLERVQAQLAMIKASLQAVEARLVRLAAHDAAVDASQATTLEDLAEMVHAELGILEASVEAATDPL